MADENITRFQEAVKGLLAGDFSRLEPLFESASDGQLIPIIKWFDDGFFDNEPNALAEAFTCACFNGNLRVVEYLIGKGVDPSGGIKTGLNAFHWAANRGQLKTVEILIHCKTPLETLNSYGGTILSCAVWSLVHEPKPDHPQIIQALIDAGANVERQ